jgi:hypothetical protein
LWGLDFDILLQHGAAGEFGHIGGQVPAVSPATPASGLPSCGVAYMGYHHHLPATHQLVNSNQSINQSINNDQAIVSGSTCHSHSIHINTFPGVVAVVAPRHIGVNSPAHPNTGWTVVQSHYGVQQQACIQGQGTINPLTCLIGHEDFEGSVMATDATDSITIHTAFVNDTTVPRSPHHDIQQFVGHLLHQICIWGNDCTPPSCGSSLAWHASNQLLTPMLKRWSTSSNRTSKSGSTYLLCQRQWHS